MATINPSQLSLPPEVILCIMEQADIFTRIQMAQTCHLWKELEMGASVTEMTYGDGILHDSYHDQCSLRDLCLDRYMVLKTYDEDGWSFNDGDYNSQDSNSWPRKTYLDGSAPAIAFIVVLRDVVPHWSTIRQLGAALTHAIRVGRREAIERLFEAFEEALEEYDNLHFKHLADPENASEMRRFGSDLATAVRRLWYCKSEWEGGYEICD